MGKIKESLIPSRKVLCFITANSFIGEMRINYLKKIV